VPSPPSPRPSPAGRGSRPLYAVVARASAAGIVFPLSIVVGYFLGKWGGRALGLGEWTAFAGAALGVAAGFWNLYRLLRGLEGGGRGSE
jgi:hypothetical protein